MGPCDDITVDARNSIALSGGRLDLRVIWREVVFVFAPNKPGEQSRTTTMHNIAENHVGKPILNIPLRQLTRDHGKPVMAVQAKVSVRNFLQQTSKSVSFTVRRATAFVPFVRLESPFVASSADELSYHARTQFKDYEQGCLRRQNNPGWHFTVSFAWRVTAVRTGSSADRHSGLRSWRQKDVPTLRDTHGPSKQAGHRNFHAFHQDGPVASLGRGLLENCNVSDERRLRVPACAYEAAGKCRNCAF